MLEFEQELAEIGEKQESRKEYKTHIDTIRKVLRNAGKNASEAIVNADFVN